MRRMTTSFLAARAGALALLAALALPSVHAFDLQAHRGGRALAPENTLAAFDHAITLGVNTLELDINLSADDVPVVSHDMALNPDHTRDPHGRWLAATGPAIRTLTLAELQGYDVGRLDPATKYGQQFPRQQPRDGQHIPTLAALFDTVKARGATAMRFNIETKLDPAQPALSATPEAMVKAILATADAAGLRDRITLQSFDWRALSAAGQLAPGFPRAYLTSPRTLRDARWTQGLAHENFASTAELVKAAAGGSAGVTWSPSYNDLTEAQVKEAHALGLKVLPWTVNQREDMARLIGWQVDGLITDDPALLREVLHERALPLPRAFAN